MNDTKRIIRELYQLHNSSNQIIIHTGQPCRRQHMDKNSLCDYCMWTSNGMIKYNRFKKKKHQMLLTSPRVSSGSKPLDIIDWMWNGGSRVRLQDILFSFPPSCPPSCPAPRPPHCSSGPPPPPPRHTALQELCSLNSSWIQSMGDGDLGVLFPHLLPHTSARTMLILIYTISLY